MENNVIKQLKGLIADVYDKKEEKVSDSCSGRYALLKEDSTREEAAILLAHVLLDTGYFSLTTRLAIISLYSTCQSVQNELRIKYNKDYTTNKIYQDWYRDKNKFISDFGDDFVVNLTTYKERDITEQCKKLRELYDSGIGDGIYDNCILPLKVNAYLYDVDDSEFDRFLKIIRPYVKVNIEDVKESLNSDVLAYVRYLVTHDNISETDRVRLEKFQKLMRKG